MRPYFLQNWLPRWNHILTHAPLTWRCLFFNPLVSELIPKFVFCSPSAENSTQSKIHLASAGQAGIHTLGSCWNPGIRPSAGVGQQPAWVPCARGTAAPLAGRLTQENRFWRCSRTPRPASVHVRGPRVEVHPQLSNNIHPVDGALVDGWFTVAV